MAFLFQIRLGAKADDSEGESGKYYPSNGELCIHMHTGNPTAFENIILPPTMKMKMKVVVSSDE